MTTSLSDERPSDRKGPLVRALDAVARAGDRLPDPAVLFVALAVVVVAASFVAARKHVSATHPITGESLAAQNLLSGAGLRRIFGGAVQSFVTLPLVGVASTSLFGVFVAERSGLLDAAFRRLAGRLPPVAMTALVFLVSAHAAIAGDTGLFLLMPLGAILFRSAGRAPMAGLAAAFSGATGGYGAGFLLTSMDASLATITGAPATATSTYFFTCAATIALTVIGALVHHLWVEPRFVAGETGDDPIAALSSETSEKEGDSALGRGGDEAASGGAGSAREAVSPGREGVSAGEEGRALSFAGVALFAWALVVAALVGPSQGLLRDDSGSSKPFFAALPVIVLVGCLLPSAVFGYFAGSMSEPRAFARVASRAASDLGPFLVLAFAAAQLLAVVEASHLSQLIVFKAARGVGRAHLHGAPLAIGVAGLAALMGMLVPSASARWGLMAAAVVPAVVAAGGSPETALAAFRSGVGPALMVTPLLPHYAAFAACAKRWSPRAGAGSLFAATLPQAIAFGAAWLLLLAVWLIAGLPLGPVSAP